MKQLFTPLVAGAAFFCTVLSVKAQEFKTHLSKEFTVTGNAANTLSVYNLQGFIKVEGYSGNKVIIEVDETITAKDNETLETGKKEFKLEFEQNGDSMIAYIAAPYDSRPHRNWNDWDDRKRIEYRYNLEFTIKVPFASNLIVSTVNQGSVMVTDVTGSLNAGNVNGPVSISNAKGTTRAHTVNGAVNVSFQSNPPGESSFNTVNGEIKVVYQPNLSADLQFKSLNGQFYTDFQQYDILPAKVEKNQEKNGGATIYKLNSASEVRIGTGGSTAKFQTVNGSIYIKKQS